MAWLRTSCCFSAGNARTASKMACSRDMLSLPFIVIASETSPLQRVPSTGSGGREDHRSGAMTTFTPAGLISNRSTLCFSSKGVPILASG